MEINMKITKKHIFTAYAMVACAGMGAMGIYLPNKNVIDNADNLRNAYIIDDFLKEQGIPAKEVNSSEFVNKYLEMRYDKYTQYTDGEYSTEDFLENMINALPTATGSGFSLVADDSGSIVFDVVSNSWAEQQGLADGDEVVAVNGERLDKNGIEVLKKLGGKSDTECEITVSRNGEEKVINLVRHNSDSSIMKYVSSQMYGDTLYIKVDREKGSAFDEVRDAVSENTFSSVILDLRNNKGGFTEIGMGIADLFASNGILVYHAYNGEETEFLVHDDTDDIKVPIVVLVNEHTASSSEIIAALLRQDNNAVLVGTQTFGKGSFQLDEPLIDGNLHYTNGYFTVNDLDCWQGKGISPDIKVEMVYDESKVGTDEDVQLQKALEILAQ